MGVGGIGGVRDLLEDEDEPLSSPPPQALKPSAIPAANSPTARESPETSGVLATGAGSAHCANSCTRPSCPQRVPRRDNTDLGILPVDDTAKTDRIAMTARVG